MGKSSGTPKGFQLFEGIISREVEAALTAQFEQAEKETHDGHYDAFTFYDPIAFDAIFVPTVRQLFERMRRLAIFPVSQGEPRVLGCTMVGYEVEGGIPRHIDSDALSGDTVCVLSIGSTAVLHFYKQGSNREYQAVIPPRSLYVMAGESRYQWSHAIHPGPWVVEGKPIKRSRRFAILFYEPGPLYDGELLYY